jgi:hypothetical protein
MAPNAIHDDLVGTPWKEAVTYSTVTKYARMVAALSFPVEMKPPLPKLQMWKAVLSTRQYSWLLPNFRLRFRQCASFRGGSVFPDPPCTRTHTRTSRNHFASPCDIFDGSPTFDGGTEADSGPAGNRTIAGPLGAKQSTRQWHDIVTLDQSWIDLFSEHQ